jgi:hypothetical protein
MAPIEEEKSAVSSKQCTAVHRFTNQSNRRQNYMNYAMNCFLIHRFLSSSPSDFFLFADLKRMHFGKKFSPIEAYFEAKEKSYYKKGIEGIYIE